MGSGPGYTGAQDRGIQRLRTGVYRLAGPGCTGAHDVGIQEWVYDVGIQQQNIVCENTFKLLVKYVKLSYEDHEVLQKRQLL